MTLRITALSGAILLAGTLAALSQESGGAGSTSGGATSSTPATPTEQPPPQEIYTPPPPPPPAPPALMGGWYIGLGGGWDGQSDIKFSDSLGNFGTFKTNDNALLAGTIGYRLPGSPFRLELEGGYDWHDINQIDFSAGSFGGPVTMASGHANLGDVLVNAIYDFPVAPRWALSVGAGAGAGFSDVALNSPVAGSAGRTGFMWQGIAGVTYKFAPNMDLFMDYHYRDAMTGGNATLSSGDIVHVGGVRENAVLAGLRWYLWSPPY